MTESRTELTAKDRTKAAFDSFSKRIGAAGKSLASMQGKIAILVGAAGIGALVSKSLAAGDALAKQSDKLQINTKELAALNQATQLYTNAGLGTMTESLVKAEKRLGEFAANGGGAAAQWLKKFNFDIAELKSQSPGELFATYSDAIKGLNTRGEQMAAISALMGDEARNLLPLIDQGSEAMREAAEQTERFGTALSRTDLAQFEAANDSVHNMGQSFVGLGNAISLIFSPAIKWVSEQITSLVVWFKDKVRGLYDWLQSAGIIDPIDIDVNFKPAGQSELTEFKNRELESVEEFLMSKQEREFEAYANRFDILQREVSDTEKRNEMQKKLTAKYNATIIKMNKERVDKERELEFSKYANIASGFKNLTKIIAKEGKVAFLANKAFAVAEAGINTAKAVTKALPNFPLAFAVGAAGAAQIATIIGTSPGSSSTSPVSAAASINPDPIEEVQNQDLQTQTESKQEITVNLVVDGQVAASIVSIGTPIAIDNDTLNIKTENGYERIISA